METATKWIMDGSRWIMDGSRKKVRKIFKIWLRQILNIFPSFFLDSSPVSIMYPCPVWIHLSIQYPAGILLQYPVSITHPSVTSHFCWARHLRSGAQAHLQQRSRTKLGIWAVLARHGSVWAENRCIRTQIALRTSFPKPRPRFRPNFWPCLWTPHFLIRGVVVTLKECLINV